MEFRYSAEDDKKAEEFIKEGEQPRPQESIDMEEAQEQFPNIEPGIGPAILLTLESHIRIYTELAENHDMASKATKKLNPIHAWDRGFHQGWSNGTKSYLRDLIAIRNHYKKILDGK